SAADLVRCVRAVLPLDTRARVRLILRRDEFRRFWSCLIFMPRERFDIAAQSRIEVLLQSALHGHTVDSSLSVGDSPLVHLHVVVRGEADSQPHPQTQRLEREIAAALISWRDRLRDALLARVGVARALELERRYGGSFPASYRQDVEAQLAV